MEKKREQERKELKNLQKDLLIITEQVKKMQNVEAEVKEKINWQVQESVASREQFKLNIAYRKFVL